jgi:hypothetical protein
MTRFHISKRISAIFGCFVLLGAVGSAVAQDSPHDELEEWQKAKREAAREHREYLNNPKKGNYLDWRSAQRDANREYEEYLLAIEVSQRYPRGTRTWVVADSDVNDEYQEWRAAAREREREYAEYRSNPTRDNYYGWQDAIADERREYREYRALVPVSYRTASRTTVSRKKAVTRRAPVRRVVRYVETCQCD